MGTKNVKWRIVPSMTYPEMFAVKCHYEFGDLHPEYIVADNIPIEDATLIAAAPELLEALQNFVDSVTFIDPSVYPQSLEQARAAILKAKGGS